MGLPDFFVIGAPKAGTTAVHVALAQHPQLFMSRIKEPRFFMTADGAPPEPSGPTEPAAARAYVADPREYQALFDAAPAGALCGESSALYLYSALAHQRMRATVPDAKLVALVRDPVDRAHSSWASLWSEGFEPEGDFVKACMLEERRAARGWGPSWRYLDIGRYGGQLQRLYRSFPPEQVLVVRYRSLREQPAAALNRICAFLGVDTDVVTEVPVENITKHASASLRNRVLGKALRTTRALDRRVRSPALASVDEVLTRQLLSEQRRRQPLTVAERSRLIPFISDDVALLEKLTGESYADWLDPRWRARWDVPVAPAAPVAVDQ